MAHRIDSLAVRRVIRQAAGLAGTSYPIEIVAGDG